MQANLNDVLSLLCRLSSAAPDQPCMMASPATQMPTQEVLPDILLAQHVLFAGVAPATWRLQPHELSNITNPSAGLHHHLREKTVYFYTVSGKGPLAVLAIMSCT